MRLTKIYTKIGDKGSTGLVNGSKVSKSSTRIHSYGTVDELNAQIGMLSDLIASERNNKLETTRNQLYRIQNELFDLGAELATPPAHFNEDEQQSVSDKDILLLESEMDEYLKQLQPLKNFVIPGGNIINSQAHIARTVCRRAERNLVELKKEEPETRDITIAYLNRLSDWLFVIGRMVSQVLGIPEVIWDQTRQLRKP